MTWYVGNAVRRQRYGRLSFLQYVVEGDFSLEAVE